MVKLNKKHFRVPPFTISTLTAFRPSPRHIEEKKKKTTTKPKKGKPLYVLQMRFYVTFTDYLSDNFVL